jgi:hypothetical protein
LVCGELLPEVVLDGHSVLVKPEVAAAQLLNEQPGTGEKTPETVPQPSGEPTPETPTSPPSQPAPPGPQRPKRFFGNVRLDPQRASLQFSQIGEEVLQHLAALEGTELEITVEIQARREAGFEEALQRTVRENANTLGFDNHSFEED